MPTDNELMKMKAGGAITPAEYQRLMAMPHEDRYRAVAGKKIELPEPERASGGPPQRIGADMGSPGGSQTPGAKAAALEKQKASAAALRASKKKTATSSASVGSY